MNKEEMKQALGIVVVDKLNVKERSMKIYENMTKTQKVCIDSLCEDMGDENNLMSHMIRWIVANDADYGFGGDTETYMNDAHDLIYGSYDFDEHVSLANAMHTAYGYYDHVMNQDKDWSEQVLVVWVLMELCDNRNVDECTIEQMSKVYEAIVEHINKFETPEQIWDDFDTMRLPYEVFNKVFKD